MTARIEALHRWECPPSPCHGCEHEGEDKDGCCLTCKRLRQWQTADDKDFIKKLFAGRVTGSLREARRCGYRCPGCGGRIRFIDGVVYCRDCLMVFVRTEDVEVWHGSKRNAGKAAREMRASGWEWTKMAKVLKMNVRYVQKLAAERAS